MNTIFSTCVLDCLPQKSTSQDEKVVHLIIKTQSMIGQNYHLAIMIGQNILALELILPKLLPPTPKSHMLSYMVCLKENSRCTLTCIMIQY